MKTTTVVTMGACVVAFLAAFGGSFWTLSVRDSARAARSAEATVHVPQLPTLPQAPALDKPLSISAGEYTIAGQAPRKARASKPAASAAPKACRMACGDWEPLDSSTLHVRRCECL